MTSTTFHKRQFLAYHQDGRRIYETLLEKGPMTTKEIIAENPDLDSTKVRSAVTRLRNAGLIHGTRIGNGVNIWEAID